MIIKYVQRKSHIVCWYYCSKDFRIIMGSFKTLHEAVCHYGTYHEYVEVLDEGV